MKKLWFGLLAAVLAMGIATGAYASGDGNGDGDGGGKFNFGQMLPHMQSMHPDLSVDQLREMYNSCHGTGGAATSKHFEWMQSGHMMGK